MTTYEQTMRMLAAQNKRNQLIKHQREHDKITENARAYHYELAVAQSIQPVYSIIFTVIDNIIEHPSDFPTRLKTEIQTRIKGGLLPSLSIEKILTDFKATSTSENELRDLMRFVKDECDRENFTVHLGPYND